MMPPNLTTEQKEQLKMARRSNLRIEETWSLYTMFLSQDKRPADALNAAVDAVGVWADWMDANEIEPPEIEQPDFATQLGGQMGKVVEAMKTAGVPFLYAKVAGEHELPQIGQGSEQNGAGFDAGSQTKEPS